jgi:hypothetical protein
MAMVATLAGACLEACPLATTATKQLGIRILLSMHKMIISEASVLFSLFDLIMAA